MGRLSGLVIAKNEVSRIGACLDALGFCDEVLVVDSGSTDGTQVLAQAKGARVIERPFVSYADQKEFGRQQLRSEWVLSVDADEVVSPELAREIAEVVATVGPDRSAAYSIPFRNHLGSVWVRRCGYYPDRHVRLFRTGAARWDLDRPIHERLLVEGEVAALSGHIDHYSFTSISHFLEKSNRYAEAFAIHASSQGRTVGPATIVLHTVGRFLKSYFLELGILEGSVGLIVSGLQACEVFQKYARLWERSRSLRAGRETPGTESRSTESPGGGSPSTASPSEKTLSAETCSAETCSAETRGE